MLTTSACARQSGATSERNGRVESSPSSKQTSAAGFSGDRALSVIAITDSALSPLKPAADVCFELGDDSTRPFRSLVAPLCLAQALVVSTGHHLAAGTTGRRAAKTAKKKSRPPQ